jgi:predicted kinase
MSETLQPTALVSTQETPPPITGLVRGPEQITTQPVVPTEFQAITALLHEEQVLATREDLKAEAATVLSPAIEGLTPEEVPAFLGHINAEYPGVFAGQDLCMLSASRENVVIVDTEGQLVEVPVTADNSRDVLTAVKRADAERKQGHSYALRHEILKRSEGDITSDEAYTYAEELPMDRFDEYLDEPENWVPERRKLQAQIIETELESAHLLSERLDDSNPTLYALRGNTAAGKTTAVRNEPTFAKALDAEGEPSGSINPDTYKATLRGAESENGQQTVSSYQMHEEGSMIARQISRRLAEGDSSMVIDKRMSKTRNLTEVIQLAESSGKEVKILDVDVPLEVSLVRVLERPIGGEAPNVPFDAVADGFRDIRLSRRDVLRIAREDDKVTEYVLRVSDETGQAIEVARKTGPGHIEVYEGREDLLRTSVDSSSTEQTVETLAETLITDEYIEEYIGRVHAADPTSKYAQASRVALNRYKGKTLRQAVDARSSSLNEGEN